MFLSSCFAGGCITSSVFITADLACGGGRSGGRSRVASAKNSRAERCPSSFGRVLTWQVPLLSRAVKASSRKKRESLISSVELNICAALLMLLLRTRSQLTALHGSSAWRGVMAKKKCCLNWTTANFSNKHARSIVCLQAQSSLIPCFLY